MQEIDREKTKFLNTVAHDLRTPLTSIRAYADMILMFSDEPPEVHAKFLNIIVQESDKLGNLISNLMDLSRIESENTQYKREPVDLREIIDHCVSIGKEQAEALEISLETKIPEQIPGLRGDQDGLAQLMSNLLSNALKFTPSGGKIQVDVETKSVPDNQPDKREIHVCVSDTGIGIPKEYHEKVFEKFGRVKGEGQTVKEGVGLGLTIAKQIVEHHGGRIWVESELGAGSCFYFVLPVETCDEDHAAVKGEINAG